MGSAFHQLCPRYSGTLTPTAPTAIRLWDTFTFTFLGKKNYQSSVTDADRAMKTKPIKKHIPDAGLSKNFL